MRKRFIRFNEAKDNIKNVWYVIKQLICPNSSKCSQIKEIDINWKVITDTTVMVDNFVNVGPNLANKIALESGSHLDYMNIYNNNNNSMFVLPITPSEICYVTATFKFNKNAGYDNMSPNVIKSIIKNLALPLCDVFNKSLLTGCFRDKLKVAKVIPLYK